VIKTTTGRLRDYSTIYFVRQDGTGLVKIGRANNPTHRMALGQVWSPTWLRMIGTIPESERITEKSLHYKFIQYNVKGEWFREEGELADFIKSRFDKKHQDPMKAIEIAFGSQHDDKPNPFREARIQSLKRFLGFKEVSA
jgi:hypothetical protein